jgi:hypothetical protein
MRLIIAAAVLAGLVAAADRTCDASSDANNLFDAPTGTCAKWTNCTAVVCTRAGGNDTSSLACLRNTTTALNCSFLADLADDYVTCLVEAAMDDACSSSTTGFGSRTSSALTGIMSASDYRGSSLQKSCVRTACKFLNYTGKGDTCATEFGSSANESEVCYFEPSNDTNATPAPTPRSNTTHAPSATSGAASVSAAVLAVLATLALLL